MRESMTEELRKALSHPSLEVRSLVLHAGHASGIRVAELDRRIVGSIAVPLRHAARQTGLIADALKAGLGMVSPPQSYLNQCVPGERPSGFDDLTLARTVALDPSRQRWSDSAIIDYAEDTLDAQLSVGATLALTPAHVLEEDGGHARDQELHLARATVASWTARQGWRPPPQHPGARPRELYASIVVQGREVEGATPALIDAYAGLEVAGYWLVVMNAGRSKTQIAGVARLALGLQQRSGRPVVVTGIGDVHLALLASGVAAVCAGLHGMRATFPPEQIDNAEDGVAVHIFHPAILSSLPLGERYAPARRRLFSQRPCRCGAHPASEPPVGRAATIAHNRYQLQHEALEAASMDPVIAESRLLARASRASTLRRELQLGPLAAGWMGVADAARDLRALGDADEMNG